MTVLNWTYFWMIFSTGLTGLTLLMLLYLRNRVVEKTAVLKPIPVEQQHNH